MSNSRAAAFSALFGAFILHSAAQGAESNADSQLETVTVIGERVALGLDEVAGNGSLGNRALLDTPYSITVVDAEDIARRQAITLGQIFINDPSVFAAEPPGTTNWWGTQIRGLGVQSHYVDGVPMLMHWGGQFPLESVERVSALKGLGGFMYGFGSPGGIISYETKQPTTERLLVADADYFNDSAASLHLDAGGRFGGPESFGYRLNLAGQQGDFYNGAGIERTLASLAVDQPIGDSFTWYANFFHEDHKLKHEPIYFYWDLYTGDRVPDPVYDYENIAVRNSYYKTETLHGTTGLRWRINDAWKANLSVGYSRREHYANKMFGDLIDETGYYEGSVYNFAAALRNRTVQALAQGELTTGRIGHELVFGGSYQKSTDQWSNVFYWSNDFSGNLYERQDYLIPGEPDFTLDDPSPSERQQALFASDTLEFGEHWQAILGLRFTDYELGADYAITELTPTVALIYKPVQQMTLYGSYVEALEGGGWVGADYTNEGDLLTATVSRQYEIGAKYQAGRFGFTTAAFRVERGLQIEERRAGEPLPYLTQDGMVLYQGLEAIGSFDPSDGLRLGLGATLLDASIEDVSTDNAALEGRRPAGSSRWQALANFEYQLPLLRELSLHGNARYSGDAYYEDANNVRIPARTIVNVGFQYGTRIGDHRLSLTGNVNNLFNRQYWNLNTLGEARNASLGARLEW